jgi:hypothetical protein
MPDMETKNNDELIRDFMLKQKVEVADNHFTERLIRKLPAKKNYEWIIVLLAAIGTIIGLILGRDTTLPAYTLSIYNFPSEITLYYLLGGALLSPFILWFGYELLRRKTFHWI